MPRANGITRQEILASIKCQGAMTAEELSKELHISQVAVRQHLSALEAEGIITVSVERRGLGRPAHRYTLTKRGDETFPRQYDQLASALLDELRAWQGAEGLSHLLMRRRDRMQTALLSRVENQDLAGRLTELARSLNEQGYMAEAHEEEDKTLRLIKRNCAIYAVAAKHPEVCCQGDAEFYENVLGDVEVRQERSILQGDSFCEFCIRTCVLPGEPEK